MITVMFTCKQCGVTKHAVTVPARETEDVGDYVRKVAQWCGEAHSHLRPDCQSSVLDLMLPCPPEAEFVGQQIE